MPSIVLGQEFPSLQAFKSALREWAIEKGFTPAIYDSDCHRVRAGCRSAPDCPFRVRANYHLKTESAQVTTCDDEHTCTAASGASQEIKRALVSSLKFLLEVVPQHITVTRETAPKTIVDIVKEKYGQDIALRQAQKVKKVLCPKPKHICARCGLTHSRSMSCNKARTFQPLRRAKTTTTNGANNLSQNDLGSDADMLQVLDQSIATYDVPVAHGPQPVYADVDRGLLTNPDDQVLQASDNLPVQATQEVPLMLEAQTQPTDISQFQVQQQTPEYPHMTGIGARPQGPSGPPEASNTPHPLTSVPPQLPRTPRDARLEAARLMQNAARLMQEAARLNAEAARLTASAANMG
ncbi:hypothetical protein MMC13_003291 [Lambiella insularis]|nr:hypothetical protein [Lambiella insularis]